MSAGFEDLIVWREAAALAAAVIRDCVRLRGPGAAFAADQMVGAAESVPANIAEGYGRGVSRDCIRFLKIARGSACEVESQLRVSEKAGRLSPDSATTLIAHTCRVRYLLGRFLDSVERRSHPK